MITTWTKGLADDNMPEAILVGLLDNVRRHPWWRARAKLALAILREKGLPLDAHVLDLGCGWGTNLDALEKAGYRATGLDISRQVLEAIDAPNRQLIEADLTKEIPENVEHFDALLALDVIEHIDDDRAAVQRCASLLKPGGLAIFSVPALPELYSEFDSIQGHRRRYLPETLRAAFDNTGLAVEKIFFWGAWMVPILKLTRGKVAKRNAAKSKTYADFLRLPPWPGPLLMAGAYALEERRSLRGSLKTGTTLFAIARNAS